MSAKHLGGCCRIVRWWAFISPAVLALVVASLPACDRPGKSSKTSSRSDGTRRAGERSNVSTMSAGARESLKNETPALRTALENVLAEIADWPDGRVVEELGKLSEAAVSAKGGVYAISDESSGIRMKALLLHLAEGSPTVLLDFLGGRHLEYKA